MSVLEEAFLISKRELGDIGPIVFGVTNQPGGTCALENVMEYVSMLPENNTIVVVSIHGEHFLGRQESLEPDAISGVEQFLLLSLNTSVKSWTKEAFQRPDVIPKTIPRLFLKTSVSLAVAALAAAIFFAYKWTT